MSNLLRAGFARLKKDKVFWVCILFMAGLGIFMSVQGYLEAKETGFAMPLDDVLFRFTIFTGVLAAVFTSLFIGAEYSDGTIRNKIVVGQTRGAVYLSNLIVTTVAALLANLTFIIAVCAAGIPLLGPFTLSAPSILLLLLASVPMTVAHTSIFTLLSMLNQNKAVVAIVSILGAILMLAAAVMIDQRLREPEFYEYFEYSVDGAAIATEDSGLEMMPNPNYLQPDERAVYQFLYDAIPGGQAGQIMMRTPPHPWRMQLYSLIIIAATTTAGVFFFRRKDLK